MAEGRARVAASLGRALAAGNPYLVLEALDVFFKTPVVVAPSYASTAAGGKKEQRSVPSLFPRCFYPLLLRTQPSPVDMLLAMARSAVPDQSSLTVQRKIFRGIGTAISQIYTDAATSEAVLNSDDFEDAFRGEAGDDDYDMPTAASLAVAALRSFPAKDDAASELRLAKGTTVPRSGRWLHPSHASWADFAALQLASRPGHAKEYAAMLQSPHTFPLMFLLADVFNVVLTAGQIQPPKKGVVVQSVLPPLPQIVLPMKEMLALLERLARAGAMQEYVTAVTSNDLFDTVDLADAYDKVFETTDVQSLLTLLSTNENRRMHLYTYAEDLCRQSIANPRNAGLARRAKDASKVCVKVMAKYGDGNMLAFYPGMLVAQKSGSLRWMVGDIRKTMMTEAKDATLPVIPDLHDAFADAIYGELVHVPGANAADSAAQATAGARALALAGGSTNGNGNAVARAGVRAGGNTSAQPLLAAVASDGINPLSILMQDVVVSQLKGSLAGDILIPKLQARFPDLHIRLPAATPRSAPPHARRPQYASQQQQPKYYASMTSKTLVDSPETLKRFEDAIPHIECMGLDAEWASQADSPIAILQIAVRTREEGGAASRHVYLVDMLMLDAQTQVAPVLAQLFANPRVVLYGFNPSGDVAKLRSVMPGLPVPAHIMDLGELPFAQSSTVLAERLARLGLADKRQLSLSDVAMLVLGCAVDKRVRMTWWNMRPLRQCQLDYAAGDADILIDIYDAWASYSAAP
ncbi:hypothetical protein BC831DRAFT_447403 [Entophlyctis helioformis]|nr:hypothetical protein BC831DRAFT_447403 [Entophlyctis helioformis]